MAVLVLLAQILAAPDARATDPGAAAFVYYQDPRDNSQRNQYAWQLLAKALEHTTATYGPFTLGPSSVAEEHPNVNSLLNAIGGVNVSVSAAPMNLPDKIIPVRFPIDRGMLGFRVLEIREGDQGRFDAIANLEDLKAVRICSRGFWGDTAIMRGAGLTVVAGDSFEGLFKMLGAGRCDAVTRGYGEAIREMTERPWGNAAVAIERHVLLHYPMPVYFWFRNTPDGRQRAVRVEAGLRTMQADGSFEAFFRQEFAETIAKIEHDRRRVIDLDNPLLGDQEPLKDERLWYRPVYQAN
jgi:ABC-type amino acid transport substrate-binding protein